MVKDCVVKVRVSEEMMEEIRSRGTISEVVRGFIEDGLRDVPQKLVSKKPRKYKEGESVPQAAQSQAIKGIEGLSEGSFKNLEQMCRLSGMSIGRFMEYVIGLFEDGHIYVEGMTVRTRGEEDLRELREICHRLNVEPQMMIDKLTKSLMRG